MNDTFATQTENTLQYIKLAEEKLIEVANYSAEQLPAIPAVCHTKHEAI